MRKFILLFNFILAVCYTINVYADRKTVALTSDHRPGGSQGHPCAHPTVTYDDDEITIKSDSTITDLTVVVKNQYGQVLHSSTVTASQDGTIIYVPSDGDSEKTTIDLYYKREHAKGYF